MKCSKCGADIQENASFCSNCGQSINNVETLNQNQNVEIVDNNQKNVNQDIEVLEPINTQVKKKSNKVLFLIIALVALCAIGIGAYFIFINIKPKNIFMNYVNNASDRLLEGLEGKNDDLGLYNFLHNYDNVNIKGSVEAKLTVNNDSISAKFDTDVILNKLAKKLKADVNVNLENEDYLGASFIVAKDKFYAKLKEFANYYIITDDLNTDKLFEAFKKDSVADIKKVVKYYKESLNESILDTDIVEDTEKINLFNEEIDAKKYTIKVTKELLNRINKNFVDKVKNDKDLVKSLCDSLEIDESTINEYLDKFFKEAEDDPNLDIVYYANSSKLVLLKIGQENSYISISTYKDNFEYKDVIKYLDYEINVMGLSAIKDNDHYNVVLKDGNKELVKGTVSLTKNRTKADLTLDLDEYGKINIKSDIESKHQGNSYLLQGDFNVSYTLNNNNLEIDLKFSEEASETSEISDSEYSNAKDINYLSRVDEEQLNNLVEKLENSEFAKAYEKIFGTSIISNSTNAKAFKNEMLTFASKMDLAYTYKSIYNSSSDDIKKSVIDGKKYDYLCMTLKDLVSQGYINKNLGSNYRGYIQMWVSNDSNEAYYYLNTTNGTLYLQGRLSDITSSDFMPTKYGAYVSNYCPVSYNYIPTIINY